MCVSLQRRAIQNVKIYVSLQRRAQKCMEWAHSVGSRPRHTKIIVSPQFRTSDHHEVTKGFPLQPGLAGATYKFTVKMTSTWSPCAIYTVYTTISPGLAGATYKFTVKMTLTWSPCAIYTVYTTISPGLAGATYKFTVKMKSTWSPRAIYTVYTMLRN